MGKRLAIFILSPLFLAQFSAAQKPVDTLGINYRYKQHYDFITMPDTIYTFQTEFILPEGYRHADSSELTPFQNYVANFPLWHRFIPVGSFRGERVFEHDQISRPVHLPYNGPAFTDRTTPIRILAEFLHDKERELDLVVVPNSGDTMKYKTWLQSSIVYGPKMAVKFEPAEPKDATLKEYYTFMRFCLENTSYQSLAYNCDTIAAEKLRPGDLFVAHDDAGTKGAVYVIMHMLEKNKEEKLYAVATGCEEACDFHIPLFNNDRSNPWITAAQIMELGKDYPHRGFLRLKIH